MKKKNTDTMLHEQISPEKIKFGVKTKRSFFPRLSNSGKLNKLHLFGKFYRRVYPG